jgi:CBS domain-containing protein
MERPYRPIKALLAEHAPGVHSVGIGATVLDALRLMAEKNIGAVVVLRGEQLAGIFTERDYARKGILANRFAKDTPITDVMTKEVVYVTGSHTVPQCMGLMADRHIRHLPVIDEGKLLGILSIRDLLKEVVSHHEHVIKDLELERLVLFAQGTYSC